LNFRLSGPIKDCFSKENGLDLEQLLSDGNYKEQYRLKMVQWSEEIRLVSVQGGKVQLHQLTLLLLKYMFGIITPIKL